MKLVVLSPLLLANSPPERMTPPQMYRFAGHCGFVQSMRIAAAKSMPEKMKLRSDLDRVVDLIFSTGHQLKKSDQQIMEDIKSRQRTDNVGPSDLARCQAARLVQ